MLGVQVCDGFRQKTCTQKSTIPIAFQDNAKQDIPYEKTFVNGNSADNGSFKSAAFTAVAKLKANCLVIQQLVNFFGFGWDDSIKMVTNEESAWKKYLEAHSEAKYWHYNPFSLYKDILGLIEDSSFILLWNEMRLCSYHLPDTLPAIPIVKKKKTKIFPLLQRGVWMLLLQYLVMLPYVSTQEHIKASSLFSKDIAKLELDNI
ncbi:hypothetical protein HD554DRAFT_2041246 [Boletus coccyginus]|nr:hypothetical protein HD554DRAFT_2041246 [Boletus coccyginus]